MRAKRISNGELPEKGQYVLGYLKKDNWCDDSDTLDNRYFKVVKFSPCEPHGNNQTPYEWREFGPSTYFGHEIDVWYPLEDLDRD
ncbi:hypothetical protein NVP1089O_85 [Vibrio phage 1.089.O._10N.261.51.F9]|nr:hypothetical protein NVP1012O_86 [Vibrio phage 1.012.O._10N.261.48.C12]AUR86823.1 hypothetical protein NVP1089O_85 [Vibrio phage 1.089.O._10N.261.51.F9]AUR87329.1 hypothetical protein NVP1098O_85 [Vibrio phage 1.098.O._10N.286.51.B9]AUR88842.1 hypothetical protein NVP1118A_82 [Vibrio phage 1.118.A._10N.261.49.F6]AUR88938.1 hypothetical protein NVP1118B_82 [Vibrio phage 1.118.B._10N.261.49.F6]AUR91430.1 hypothetical protein NVP1160O_81 [Vibrio phage 1.160.O._10N.261.48.B11]AUR97140.1 hypoth